MFNLPLLPDRCGPALNPNPQCCVDAAKKIQLSGGFICWGLVLHLLKDTVCSLLLAWFQLAESSSTDLHMPTLSGINFLKWNSFLTAEANTICHHFENKLLWEAKPMLPVLLPSLSNCHQHPNYFLLCCLLHMFSKITTETSRLLRYQHKILLKAISYCLIN